MKQLSNNDIAKLVHRVFSTEDGQKLLTLINTKFLYEPEPNPNAVNVGFEAGLVSGNREVIKWINTQMANSQNLTD